MIDTERFAVAATVETGKGAHGIVIDPSSRHAYVTNPYGDDVAVLDLQELRVVARVRVGDKPNGVSFSPVLVRQQPPVAIKAPEGVGGHDASPGGGDTHGGNGP
ncbi:YncE family protein [Intrasporangium chromatireducens]|uniref:YncE family protein n=1 Tax=Intrasporangium chromatireducens TaxID=1386088 RepID=UPI0004AF60BD|nr:hypothetical protein [Intrasporangium chromatireducens]